MRILVVAADARPEASDAGEAIHRLGSGLRGLGHSIDLASPEPAVPLGDARRLAFASALPSLRGRVGEYDLVNLHGPAAGVSEIFLLGWNTLPRRSRPPLVYTHHGDEGPFGTGPLTALYQRAHSRLVRVADAVIVSGDGQRRELRASGVRAVHVVPLAAPDAADPALAIHPPRPSRFTVAFAGRLRPHTGVGSLVRAAAALPDVDFDILGAGPLGARLRAFSRELGLTNLRWHGPLEGPARDALLRRAHCIAVPAERAEGFSAAVVEGMRAGCVPVGSDLSGIRELAGETGLLVKPGSVRSLVEAISYLRDNPHDWQRRSRGSRESARRYGWDRTVLAYHRVLHETRLEAQLRRSLAPAPLIEVLRTASFADRASLMLLDPGAGRLRIAAVTGLPLPIEAMLAGARPGHEVAWGALRSGEPVLLREPQQPRGRTRPVRRALVVPLLGIGASGVINLSRVGDRDFDIDDVAWVQAQSRRIPLPRWGRHRGEAEAAPELRRLYASWRWG